MTFGNLMAILAAAAAMLGAPALAQEAPPPPPPPPATLDPAGVQAWVRDHVDTRGWLVLGADTAAVSFLSAQGVIVGPDGFLRSEVRREYFGGTQLGPNGSRSVRQAWVVDCKARKIWVQKIAIYPEHNLKGRAVARENPTPKWTEVSSGSINDKLMIEICHAPSAGAPPPAPESPT